MPKQKDPCCSLLEHTKSKELAGCLNRSQYDGTHLGVTVSAGSQVLSAPHLNWWAVVIKEISVF